MMWLIFDMHLKNRLMCYYPGQGTYFHLCTGSSGGPSLGWFSSASTTIVASVKILFWQFAAATCNYIHDLSNTHTLSVLYNEFSVTCVLCVLRGVVSLRGFF